MKFTTTFHQFADRLNILLQRLVELGMIRYFNEKASRMLQTYDAMEKNKNGTSIAGADRSTSETGDHIDVGSVTLTELTFILVVVMIGYLSSVSVFIIELIFHRFS